MSELENNSELLVELTDSAANEINKIKTRDNVPEEYGLRLGVRSRGCCGLEYILGFENNIHDNDIVYDSKGIKIIIDDNSIDFLAGAKLDFQSDEHGQGFIYHNIKNNFGSSCDCENGNY